MCDKNNVNNENSEEENKTDTRLNMVVNRAEQRKSIENTYNLYSSQKVEIKEDSKARPSSTTLNEKKSSEPEVIKHIEPIVEQKTEPKRTNEASKPIALSSLPPVKQITSVQNLKPELQKIMKQSLSTEDKEKVNEIITEMESQSSDFFMNDENGVLGNIKKSDKAAVTKKLSEMEVPREITEINVSAIVSFLSKKKNR